MNAPAPWMTVKQVAEMYSVTERFVREQIATGNLPASRVGGRIVRIRREDAERLAEPVVSAPATVLPIGRRVRSR